MGAAAQNLVGDILRYQVVDHLLEYAMQVLDKNYTGLLILKASNKSSYEVTA